MRLNGVHLISFVERNGLMVGGERVTAGDVGGGVAVE